MFKTKDEEGVVDIKKHSITQSLYTHKHKYTHTCIYIDTSSNKKIDTVSELA